MGWQSDNTISLGGEPQSDAWTNFANAFLASRKDAKGDKYKQAQLDLEREKMKAMLELDRAKSAREEKHWANQDRLAEEELKQKGFGYFANQGMARPANPAIAPRGSFPYQSAMRQPQLPQNAMGNFESIINAMADGVPSGSIQPLSFGRQMPSYQPGVPAETPTWNIGGQGFVATPKVDTAADKWNFEKSGGVTLKDQISAAGLNTRADDIQNMREGVSGNLPQNLQAIQQLINSQNKNTVAGKTSVANPAISTKIKGLLKQGIKKEQIIQDLVAKGIDPTLYGF
jgi:hypothetical protein